MTAAFQWNGLVVGLPNKRYRTDETTALTKPCSSQSPRERSHLSARCAVVAAGCPLGGMKEKYKREGNMDAIAGRGDGSKTCFQGETVPSYSQLRIPSLELSAPRPLLMLLFCLVFSSKHQGNGVTCSLLWQRWCVHDSWATKAMFCVQDATTQERRLQEPVVRKTTPACSTLFVSPGLLISNPPLYCRKLQNR